MYLPDGFIIDLEYKLQALKDIRKAAGMTQADVGKLLGVDKAQVSRWEQGKQSPNWRELVTLTRFIDNLQLKILGASENQGQE